MCLAGRVYIVTGSNSGIGKEIAQFLATKGATVYMLCRSQQRAENARADIVAKAGGDAQERIHILLADCSLETEVRRCWDDFCEHSIARSGDPTRVRLDGLVCNAGALANTKTTTAEGIELTFASHLLFGLGPKPYTVLPFFMCAICHNHVGYRNASGDGYGVHDFDDDAKVLIIEVCTPPLPLLTTTCL
ncbi:DHRS12 [Symbiodinium sp. CCMP2592]|nr:DHRS12 [Symbiodinium sp. CCMP2592]